MYANTFALLPLLENGTAKAQSVAIKLIKAH
jgi:hypothetical protein